MNKELLTRIEKLEAENQTLRENLAKLKTQTKTPEKIKETKEQATQTDPTFFYCDNCQQNKHGTYTIRKIDSPFEPRTHGKFCYICSTCQKYTKEYNEKANWREENNPYKIN